MSQWTPVEKALFDSSTGLTGRPDYLIDQAGKLIPVEVKSQNIDHEPYDAHIVQLAAYCFLVEKTYRKRPDFGVLHYPNRTFSIDYSPSLEANLINLIDEIHQSGNKKEIHRSHTSARRCQGCGYRLSCDQRLL